ncbi:MAG: hypothetical protein KAR42_05635 [candidate division Zixibacteria bacterium]|nr:hypothetical protein [candidate division Zixibacteria bacterium]
MKMNQTFRLASIIVCIFILGGCAAPIVTPRLLLEEDIRPYSNINFSTKCFLAENLSKEMARLEEKVNKRLMKIDNISGVRLNAPCQNTDENLMCITATITDIKKVSETAIFFFGIFAGTSHINVEVTITHAKSGRTLGSYEVVGNHGGTNTSIDLAAKGIANIIKDHLKKLDKQS